MSSFVTELEKGKGRFHSGEQTTSTNVNNFQPGTVLYLGIFSQERKVSQIKKDFQLENVLQLGTVSYLGIVSKVRNVSQMETFTQLGRESGTDSQFHSWEQF